MQTEIRKQVEAIVTKYKNSALELNGKTDVPCGGEGHEFDKFESVPQYDATVLMRDLIGRIYLLRAGSDANADIVNVYRRLSEDIKSSLTEEDKLFLVENFEVFVDYTLDLLRQLTDVGDSMYSPWSSLIPDLLENHSGEIFLPNNYNVREFAEPYKYDKYNLTFGEFSANEALRAYVKGMDYQYHIKQDNLWSDLRNGQFDIVIYGETLFDNKFDNATLTEFDDATLINSCLRIVKEGGEVFYPVDHESVVNDKKSSLYELICKGKYLKNIIQLPFRRILLHFVKKAQDSVVVCDVTPLVKNGNKNKWDIDLTYAYCIYGVYSAHNNWDIDITAFREIIKKANMSDNNDTSQIIRRVSYDELKEKNILLPSVYLYSPKEGIPVCQAIEPKLKVGWTDEFQGQEKVVTINQLSKVFSKCEFHVDDLHTLDTSRSRLYRKVEGPVVIIAVSEKEVIVGYTTEETSFLVAANLYLLKPVAGLDVRYFASLLLSSSVQRLLTELAYTDYRISHKLISSWDKLIRLNIPSVEEQQKIVQETVLKDFSIQENHAAMREKGFMNSIRLRKHALSQNVSAFDSLFRSLEYCMQEHNGSLNAKDRLSPVSPMTVENAMEVLHSELQTICNRVAQLTNEQDWGKCEAIEPEEFIEEYEKEHLDPTFSFEPHITERSWGHRWGHNRYEEDVLSEDGKLLFRKGDVRCSAWFPKKALKQVFDNIVANAREHGFTDKSRKDYCIDIHWMSSGFNMFICISNNGTPMPSDLDTGLVLEYGYSSVLNERGHGGIGGGEIAEIMRQFGGDVRVISFTDKKHTVIYALKIPLASSY